MIEQILRNGIVRPDQAGQQIFYRFRTAEDKIEEVTRMLHEAYAPLAEAGMRFVASYQDNDVTESRMAKGETIVALDGPLLVGIVTLKEIAATNGSPFYDRPDVASFGQFAVRPSHQNRGIGSALLQFVEERALEKGVAELALDTSENASGLIAFYKGKGYRFVEHVQWNETNYRSMIFAKCLLPAEQQTASQNRHF